MANIGSSLTAAALADMAGMSARNLARLFAQEAGVTPHEFVERARVDAARNRLEGTERALKVIAHECGFASDNHMRAVFAKLLGVSPSQYRGSFRVFLQVKHLASPCSNSLCAATLGAAIGETRCRGRLASPTQRF